MARKRRGLKVDGWIIVDKPRGMTSTQAIGKTRRATQAAKLGHGGTLDPEATGVLPMALGEATKTIPYCQDATKVYEVTVRWGQATATDDAEGEVIETSDHRPDATAIAETLPAFIGTISQMPPLFSALKVEGQRAYDLARRGETPDLKPRDVRIEAISHRDSPDADHSRFEVTCGKGTYIRSLARDLAVALRTVGHVADLRRTRVGPFTESMAICVDKLAEYGNETPPFGALLPVETALDDIPAFAVTETQASLLRQGQTVEVPETSNGTVQVRHDRNLVALGEVEEGILRPVRVFNLMEK
ncbi:MAG: tRNA pseudouridine(55) synthase TruB [Rhodospirillaceae bacterium]|nr:tRNA pseudouridine(55) synthase TruB [Rhodospirillaceae bacterium]|tara:strand:+ start:1661 stop:2566 length:906 start_codon:yes stop_codon:yes gene_type:complete